MRILYFAQARLAAGISEESFHTTESLSAEKLWHLLIHRHPALLPLHSSAALVPVTAPGNTLYKRQMCRMGAPT